MKKIGIIGYGTIGRFIVEQLKDNHNIEILFVYDPFIDTPDEISDIHVITLDESLVKSVDLVVEAAISEVVHKYCELILTHTDFVIFSATALANDTYEELIKKTAKENNTTCYIPHGAALGLDGIFDANSLINSVEIVTTKKPQGFSIDCSSKSILYEGSTRGACLAYPRNVNIHASIALAGIGMDNTHSRIIADPDIPGNTHVISVVGDGINFSITIESTPLGQVTGVYTPRSALGSVIRILNNEKGINFV